LKIQGNKPLAIFIIVITIIWLILVPVRLIGKDCLQYYSLEKAGVETKARVLLLEPQNHQTTHYSYEVQSVEYGGEGRADFGNPGFNSIKPGMELRVFYFPQSPEISCLGLPHELLVNDLIPFSLFLVFVCIMLVVQYRRWMRLPTKT